MYEIASRHSASPVLSHDIQLLMLFKMITAILIYIYGNIGSYNTSNVKWLTIEGEFFCYYCNGKQHKQNVKYIVLPQLKATQ